MTPQISIWFDDARLDEIKDLAENEGVTRSQYIRDSIGAREQLAECRRENDRLQRRVRALIEQREEHTELVEYVEGGTPRPAARTRPPRGAPERIRMASREVVAVRTSRR